MSPLNHASLQLSARSSCRLLALGMAAASALAVPSVAHAQTQVSAAKAVASALGSNPDVRTAQANLTEAQAELSATLADPSALVVARTQAQQQAALAQAQLRASRLNTLQGTLSAYTDLLLAQKSVELRQLQVGFNKKGVDIAQVKLNVGNATPLDVQTARNDLASAQQSLVESQAQVSLASSQLATVAGLGSGVRAAGPVPLPNFSADLARLRRSLGDLPSLVQARQAVEQAELQVRLADNDFTPARTLEDARVNLENARRSLVSARDQAEQGLKSAYQNVTNTYELLSVAKNNEAAAYKAYQQAGARFKSGTISAVALEQSRLSLKQAQFSRVQAQSNVVRALASLSTAAGQNLTGVGGQL